ncbi:helix-turn-helix domain-containing protein [Paraburkholderia phytofirmans]|uniref:helix-turn-helix domain-containing protein n=1 Tax=Paraburkholderia sp. BL9I2N2 TaxID=1938809 RepID=UPI0010F34DB5|nr:helix-turn-helix domain-containing protein [Paraburkholderia sp. BL9I2N2]TCK96002.1 helix-turn-helix protein [Paraburkholderia sp. BL9I2N2]
MTTNNEKGRNSGKSATQKTTKSNHRDMSAAAQCKRVLDYLKADGQTTYSLRAKGISHPAQRVKELIQQGFRIYSHRVTAVDSDGYSHANVARYSLIDRELDLVDMMEAA